MFANLGIESEHRESHKRPTGRRHVPREMTSEAGVPNFGTHEAAMKQRASEQFREDQIEKANVGPSFMDTMFDKENKRDAAQNHHGHGVNRPAETPKDQLNLFAWEGKSAGKPAGQSLAVHKAAALAAPTPACVNDAEARRLAEARKFEQNTTGSFLAFSENRKPQPPAHSGKKMGSEPAKDGLQAPFATGEPPRNNADPHNRGKRGAPLQKRRGDGGTVQGFKGMGDQCNSKRTGRKVGRNEPSQVFLPQQTSEQHAQAQPSAAPQRPAWLHSDNDENGGSPAGRQQQSSVKFEDRPGGHPGDEVLDDERYYVDSDEAYFREQQMLYEHQQQADAQRRVPQFQRHSRHSADAGEDNSNFYRH